MSFAKDFTKLVPVNKDDPKRFDQYELVHGINRMADLINSLNRDMENRILLIISIIISAVLGFFLAEGKILLAINLSILLGILLIISLIKEAKEKLKFKEMLLKTYENALANGIKLK